MDTLDSRRLSWKHHLRYVESVQKQPHTPPFKRFLLGVWERLHSSSACSLCWPWWASKYNSRHTPPMDVSQEQLCEWSNADCALPEYAWKHPAHASKEALLQQCFVAEYHTTLWLLSQNNKGIAVPSPALLRFYLAQWERPATSAECYDHLQRIQRQHYERKWLHSFRKRWNVMWRRLPARSPLPADEARRKAPHACAECRAKKTDATPILVQSGSQKWTTFRFTFS